MDPSIWYVLIVVLAVVAGALVTVLSAIAHAAPIPETDWGLPKDVSVDGWRTDHLIMSTSIFIAIMFIATSYESSFVKPISKE